MNVIKAAYDLKDLIERKVINHDETLIHGSKYHLMYMCDRITGNEMDDNNQRVEGEKAHRWIGWIQGCLYMNGVVTLEEMKSLNKRA